jgi:hypothetical protein
VLYGPIHLPPILPTDAALYTVLRKAHTVLAYLLFFTFIAHVSAVLLFHTLVMRDGLLKRMVPWNVHPAVKAVPPRAPLTPDSAQSGEHRTRPA